jgi:hypothetical protein
VPEVFDVATIRPHDWDIALYLHVLGAMVATGGLVLALIYLALAWRGNAPGMFRAGYKALLYGAVPGYVVMRLSAQWIASKEGIEDSDLSWLGIGFAVGDIGLLFLLIATITAGVSSRRNPDGSAATIRVSAVATAILLVAYVIAVWAMTTKPV